MTQEFIAQLTKWHEDDEFEKIIAAIEELPSEKLDYELTGHLARAYNNRGGPGDYDRALELLHSVEEEGAADPNWHFRVGYAHYYADREKEAILAFERVLELDPEDEAARRLVNKSRKILQQKAGQMQEDLHPELYAEEELNVLDAHMERWLGTCEKVYHEIASPDIHVDLMIYAPTEDRNYYIVATQGMGAHRMNVPEDLKNQGLDRAELLVLLPPDWKLASSDEDWYWPLRWLKIMARFPGERESWLGWGHTVSGGGPVADNTALFGVMLVSPVGIPEEGWRCAMPDGGTVNFYLLLPLYEEEMAFKREHGAGALLDRMGKVGPVVDPARPNVCARDTDEAGNDIWNALGIAPTDDVRAIRRAYAKAAGRYHPEEQPEEFQRVRAAYEKALALAKLGQGEAAPQPLEAPVPSAEPEESEAPPPRWRLDALEEPQADEAAPFREGAAMEAFWGLYSDAKKWDDVKQWRAYFTSEVFLDVWREPGFAVALAEYVTGQAEERKPRKRFLWELSLVYGVRYVRREVHMEEGSRFEYEPVLAPNAGFGGVGHILKVTALGEPMTRPPHEEERIRGAAYIDYMELLALARTGDWGGENRNRLRELLHRYAPSYVTDRPPVARRAESVVDQRHPDSLRLLAHFLKTPDLPEEVLALAWDAMYLEGASGGSSKRWFGPLRELVLARISEAERLSLSHQDIFHVNKAFTACRDKYRTRAGDPAEREELDALWTREDFRRIMLHPRFLEDQVLHYWIYHCSAGVLESLRDCYLPYREVPLAAQLLERVAALLRQMSVEEENKADERQNPSADSDLSFTNRQFWRYYLSVAFPFAQAVEGDGVLGDYMTHTFQPSMTWRKRFVGFDEMLGRIPEPPALTLSPGETQVTVVFHLYHIDFEVDKKLVTGPVLAWDAVREYPNDAGFWLLLPLTAAHWDQRDRVRQELEERLAALPLHPAAIPMAADCLTGYLCTRRLSPDTVLWARRESAEALFSYEVYENNTLMIYRETVVRRVPLTDLLTGFGSQEAARAEGERQLEELTRPQTPENFRLPLLPFRVDARPALGARILLWGEAVTQEAVQDLLAQAMSGALTRLELSWGTSGQGARPGMGCYDFDEAKFYYGTCRSIVLLQEGKRFLCLYFDDGSRAWGALLGEPEVYRTVDMKDLVEEPFGLSKVKSYLLHRSLALVRRALPPLLERIEDPAPLLRNHNVWSYNTLLRSEPVKYNRVKRELALFPVEAAHNNPTDAIELECVPARMAVTAQDGEIHLDEGTAVMRETVNYQLGQYLKGRLLRLELTWRMEAEGQSEPFAWERTLVFQQEAGKHLISCFDDLGMDIWCLVSDEKTYLDVDSKQVRRVLFQGRRVEDYLLWEDLRGVRDELDLLLPHIRNPGKVFSRFGVWAPETCGRDRVAYDSRKRELGGF